MTEIEVDKLQTTPAQEDYQQRLNYLDENSNKGKTYDEIWNEREPFFLEFKEKSVSTDI